MCNSWKEWIKLLFFLFQFSIANIDIENERNSERRRSLFIVVIVVGAKVFFSLCFYLCAPSIYTRYFPFNSKYKQTLTHILSTYRFLRMLLPSLHLDTNVCCLLRTKSITAINENTNLLCCFVEKRRTNRMSERKNELRHFHSVWCMCLVRNGYFVLIVNINKL
jgi:hypothetical protein